MDEPPKNPPDDYSNTIVTGKELADVVGLSQAHIFTLLRREIVQQTRARKNEYQLGPSMLISNSRPARILKPEPIFIRKEPEKKLPTGNSGKSSWNKLAHSCTAAKLFQLSSQTVMTRSAPGS
jgi:hypothetical protein